MKRYVIFAGVNGAGKTTLYQTDEVIKGLPRVNLDEIVRKHGNWKNPRDVAAAGKRAVVLIRQYMTEGKSFNQETTLCGKSILRNIEKAKEIGYQIEIYFVGLASAELAIERVKQRVKAGGHGIPEADILRRYEGSMENLIRILPMCDRVELYDNTELFYQVATFEKGHCIDRVNTIPDWCKRFFDS